MHVEIDRVACRGHGNCLVNAADYFDLDDDDVVISLRDGVGIEDVTRISVAVDSCPVAALKVVS
ncbi:hypothetical protein BH11ACT7_BH11ACT7_03280 [soil metagenome]